MKDVIFIVLILQDVFSFTLFEMENFTQSIFVLLIENYQIRIDVEYAERSVIIDII